MMAKLRLTKLLILATAICGLWCAAAQAADMEVLNFTAGGTNQDSTPSIGAGTRPFELSNGFEVNTLENPDSHTVLPAENLKNVKVELPPGMIGNAAALPKCTEKQLETATYCPMNTQIGVAQVVIQLVFKEVTTEPIWNMEPPPGMPAQFAFIVVGPRVHVNFHVRTGSDYGVIADIHNLNNTAPVYSNKFTLWGVPADPSHDAERVGCGEPTCPSTEPRRPLLSNPTSCEGSLDTTVEVTTWQLPEDPLSTAPAEAPAMTDCNQVDFSPTIEAKPTTNLADSPSGLDFHLHIPQNEDPDGTAEAQMRQAKLELPPGVTINAASANGLGGCSSQQVGYIGPRGERQALHYGKPGTASFTVSFEGETTAPLAADSSKQQVTQAIETLPGLAGNIRLEGASGGWIVIFTNEQAGKDVPQLGGEVNDNRTETIEMTGEDGSFNLESGGASTAASFEASFEGPTTAFQIQNPTRGLNGGEPIEGPGIAPGTKISFLIGNFMFLTQATTEKVVNGHFTSELASGPSAEVLQGALQSIPSLGGNNVFVTDGGVVGSTHTYHLLFANGLAGAQPTITADSHLTGPGAGIVITQDPATPPHALDAATLGGIATGTPQFTEDPANCPDSAKVGTARIDTPLLDHPMQGSIYLATPGDNPFHSLLAIYLAVDDAESGIVLKLPGMIQADPKTGRLTATFSETPQLPFEDLQLEFFKGAVAPLKTGIACGTYEVKTDLTPWTAPEGAVVHPEDSYEITHGAGGGPCAKDEASAPDTPGFEAGTFEPTAGIYSPFTLKLTRPDGAQQLTGIDTTLPEGLLAKLAGVPYCSDAALAAAASKTGRQELADPSCPAASRVGSVSVGAGAGPTPYYVNGNAYLAGPYKDAPLSLAVVTPAVAGPFDIGDVVVRNALYVDRETTKVHVVSDPIPTILEGIPLSIRSVLVNLDRPDFTRNPTSCSPLAVTGIVSTLPGQSAAVGSPFQVGDCGKLGFKPKIALSLRGAMKRLGNPALKAVLEARDGDANISRVAVALPNSEFLDNSHIGTICTRVLFAASQCPPGSVYGYARAYSPLLEGPIEGPVYLRSATQLPDLVADLHGQINVALDGHIDTNRIGGIRATFESVPDAPISKFVLEMQGGKKGLLENSTELCDHNSRATVLIDGQNAKTTSQTPIVKTAGCKKAHHKRRRHHR